MPQDRPPAVPIGMPSPTRLDVGALVRSGAGANGTAGHPHGDSGSRRQPLREYLLAAVSPDQAGRLGERELRAELGRIAAGYVDEGGESVDLHASEDVIRDVIDELIGFGPLGGLMREVGITEILINGPHQVFVERRGQLEPTQVHFRDEEHLLRVVRTMAAATGRRLDRATPMLDTRLPDGSRLNAVLKPPALNGPLVSIRRFGSRPITTDDLLAHGSLTTEMLEFLAICVRARVNLIISGGTGSGKTSLLNALSRFIPGAERVVTIEDTAELELQLPHVAKLEAQLPDLAGRGEVTLRDLVRNSLRMRPDRIIVGECRGGETFDMLQAMSTGHDGSMTTIHANSSREALTRVELMVSLAKLDIPVRSVRTLIVGAIGIMVHVARLPGGARKIIAISEITGLEGDVISMHDLFAFARSNGDQEGAGGYFQATGVRPKMISKLESQGGASFSPASFASRRLQASRERGTGR